VRLHRNSDFAFNFQIQKLSFAQNLAAINTLFDETASDEGQQPLPHPSLVDSKLR
jgi:hypothetical protein